jgi:hypothetical protein
MTEKSRNPAEDCETIKIINIFATEKNRNIQMRKSIFTTMMIALTLGFFSCGAGNSEEEVDTSLITNSATADNPTGDPEKMPEIVFDKTEYDFGTIIEGEEVEHTFRFTNTGKSPLIITNAFGDCGCTVPEFPREAIAPNKSGTIKVKFNSAGKVGENKKKVTVESNAKTAQTIIHIKSTVVKP